VNPSTFKIQEKEFSLEIPPIADKIRFEVKSVPRPYSVIFDTNEKPGKTVQQILSEDPNYLLLIDERVWELYGDCITHPSNKILKAKATEDFKTVDGMLSVVDFMNFNKLTKGEKLVVVGGGIIQDVGAYAAATFKRGIPWVYFPTTLLSQCDSCIGGKTGLNYKQTKNQIALFSAPSQIIINCGFLKTLSQHEIVSGLGEVIKLHITGGKPGVENFLRNFQGVDTLTNAQALALVLGSLAVKKAVVEEDEFELDLRRSMNYGHTIGHALEVISEYEIPHGIAVTMGVLIVNELSVRRNLLPRKESDLIKGMASNLIPAHLKKRILNVDSEKLKSLLKKDKKTTGNTVNFVILHSIGQMKFLSLPLNDELTSEIKTIIQEVFH